MSSAGRTYKAAVDAIYKTQVFGEELRKAYNDRKNTVEAMAIYLRRLGLLQDEGRLTAESGASALRVLHVTGTKGKGSTCAYVDSLLRAQGARTVLFTSPHLVRVNERIRVDGRPISDESLAAHFWDLWDRLQQATIPPGEPPPVPGFFRLLTLLGFWVAVREKVDALVLEVGLGGRYDATNAVPRGNVVATVVNTLDLEHTEMLGSTIESIAWEKAGIMKPGVPCFVAPQAKGGLPVLQDCAKEVSAPLYLVEPLPPPPTTGSDGDGVRLGIGGDAQRINASLALAVANAYRLHTQGQPASACEALASPTMGLPWLDVRPLLDDVAMRRGVEECRWPGRCQRVEWSPPGREPSTVTVLLDGAHTEQSMAQAVQWMDEEHESGAREGGGGRRKRALVFNCSAEKNVPELFRHLLLTAPRGSSRHALRFDRVVFCPASGVKPSLATVRSPEDILSATADGEGLDLPRLLRICAVLRRLSSSSTTSPATPLPWQESLRGVWLALAVYHQLGAVVPTEEEEEDEEAIESLARPLLDRVVVRPSVPSAMEEAAAVADGAEVLVTGSLYVVGDALALVAPP